MNTNTLTTRLLFAITLLLSSSLAYSAGVNIELNVHKLVIEQTENGPVEKLITPTIAIPGDTMVYTARVRNEDRVTAEAVRVVTPIPAETTFLPGTTNGADSISYSVDGGKNFDSPERLQVLDENNKPRAAMPSDYTHIRWLIPSINANSETNVRFHARINEN